MIADNGADPEVDGALSDIVEGADRARELIIRLRNLIRRGEVSLEKVEEKIEKRKAEAMAKAELREATPEGSEMELKEAINMAQADAKLEELKAELGLA